MLPQSIQYMYRLTLCLFNSSSLIPSQRPRPERDGHLSSGLLVGAGAGQRGIAGIPTLLPAGQLHLGADSEGQQVVYGRDAYQTQ